MGRWGTLAAAWGLATAATAADKVATGPIPAWVHAQAPATAGSDDGTGVHVLLADQQVRFEHGGNTTFSESVLKLQTAQGLSAGNVAFAWDPATQAPTVHFLRVRRGDKVIDVLASQSFTVLRREQNLESATLDGVLTATLQPEGLQVGDILEFALSVETHDPVLGDHAEMLGGGWNGLPFGRAHLRAEWPASVPLRIRQPAGLPPLRDAKDGDRRSAELLVNDLAPLPAPNGAPARFGRSRIVEISDYHSWADLGALMAPLYVKAGTLPASGPLHDEWAKIDAANPDPKAKAAAILAFVEDRIRYVALAMGAGGYTPADAATTWERRFGDCKGKTAMLLAMLHASGIAAEPVLANTGGGDGLDQSLPLVGLFNHVLVRATIAGRTYWLDGTRSGDTSLDRLRIPDFGWGLPLVPKDAALVRMLPPPLDRPDSDMTATIDASQGLSLPAPFHAEAVLRGDVALATSLAVKNLSPDLRDKNLRDFWRKQFDYVEPEAVTATFDPATGEERLTIRGTATMAWPNGWFETDGTRLGWQADFHRDPGPDRDAPFANGYPFYSRMRESIRLPANFHLKLDRTSDDIDQTVAGVAYHRTVDVQDGVFVVDASQRSLAPEFSAAEAPAAQEALRKMAANSVQLHRPDNYVPTPKELEAYSKIQAKTAPEFVLRARAELATNHVKEAITDLTAAVALDPKLTEAYAFRAYAYGRSGNGAAAKQDVKSVEAINPQAPIVLVSHGEEALARGDAAAAADLAMRAYISEPNYVAGSILLARAHMALKQQDRALADVNNLLALGVTDPNIYLMKCNLLWAMGRQSEIAAVTDTMIAANPGSGLAVVAAAKALAAIGKQDQAMQDFDRAIAIKPEAYIYLNRSQIRSRKDLAGRQADLENALKLEPNNKDASLQLAFVEDEEGRYPAALALAEAQLARDPQSPWLHSLRGLQRLRLGQTQAAEDDFAAARSMAAGAEELNNLCWNKAIRGLALEAALKDCDAAIAKSPLPNFRDSRALVEFRLGRLDAALSDYDAAIAGNPKLASSLYGRSLLHARRGETALAAADAKAARAISPTVGDDYEGYGLNQTAPASTANATTARTATP